jgi:hypothetical protein
MRAQSPQYRAGALPQLIIAFNYLQNSGCLYDIIFSRMKKIYSLLLILSLVVGSLFYHNFTNTFKNNSDTLG